jgi:putative flippase GtrA
VTAATVDHRAPKAVASEAASRSDARRMRLEAAVDGLVPARLSRYREQLLYIVVGGWNTVFGYGVWALLQALLRSYVHYLLILALSYPVSTLNAYVCYRYLVFRSHGNPRTEFPRFSLVYVITMVANLALLPVLLRVLPFNVYISQALFAVVVVACSYVGHRFFSFRGGRAGRTDGER